MESNAYLFFGRSGCGKGTQAKLLSEALKKAGKEVLYIETGSRFREFIQREDNLSGKLAGEVLRDGKLIPVFLPIWIWGGIFVENFTGKQDMVLDGLCRRREESVALESAFDFYGIKKPNIILINVSNNWSETRMMERRRADDTPDKIKNRLDWYEADVVPSIEHFRNKEKFNFIEINGEQTIEQVHDDIIKSLNL
jgi:adenylate kinase family enzyme